MYRFFCRVYQFIMRIVTYFLPWRKPEVISGENSSFRLPDMLMEKGVRNVMVVTDRGITSIGLCDNLLTQLEKTGIRYIVYDRTVPNPTIANIEEALKIYLSNDCDSIIAFGGGSAMDCAKGVGMRVARPDKSVSKMRGLMKVRAPLPLLVAVPTTAGTGSETTIAAVITDEKTHEKYAINDLHLIPACAVLDPVLTAGLPPKITATTGMDALTHAVEAYIGRSNTGETRDESIEAVRLIFGNIYKAYVNGNDIRARENMQKAAFLAGAAFTRAYVGYVHAMAHALGGQYSIPHGFANAVILPYVLAYYAKSAYKPLARLSETAGTCEATDTTEIKAKKFVNGIIDLNKKMNIPDKIEGIKREDIPVLVRRALREANPLYPVPRILLGEELNELFYMVMK